MERKERLTQREDDVRLFYEHAHLFLANADKILSDSRMFLAPVNVVNGMAYTGTSGFQSPTLGVYVEWWLHYKEASIDKDGCLIWYIAGSPLSGRNACKSVDNKGNIQQAQLNGSFSSVWRSFIEVNNRYNESKSRYMAYDLNTIVEMLESTTVPQTLFKLYMKLEKLKYDNYTSELNNSLKQVSELSLKYKEKIQRLLFNQHRGKAVEYYTKCVAMRKAAKDARDSFLEKRIELRKKLRSGKINSAFFQRTLKPLKDNAVSAEVLWRECEREIRKELFGEDYFYFNFDVVKKLLEENTREMNDA